MRMGGVWKRRQGNGVGRKEGRKKRHCFLKVKCIFSCVNLLSTSFVKYISIQFPNCEICQNILHVPSPAPNPAQGVSLGFFEPISRLLTWSHWASPLLLSPILDVFVWDHTNSFFLLFLSLSSLSFHWGKFLCLFRKSYLTPVMLTFRNIKYFHR